MKKSFCIILALLVPLVSWSKRPAPEKVDPVVYKGVIYKTIPWAFQNGTDQNSGYLQAVEESSGKVLWGLQVYKTRYDSTIERDVQDVFITQLTVDDKGNVLLVLNEKGLVYRVSLFERRVIDVQIST